MSRRLRIAWFSPLSGDSVSSFVTHQLIEKLSASVDLTLFHCGEQRDMKTATGAVSVEHYLNAVTIDQQHPFDQFFYNLEDRKDCDFCRIHLALKPGIVWFHDFFLSTHGPEPILNSSWREIVARFSDARRSWPDRAREYPMAGVVAEREAGMSLLPLFSSPRDHAEYQRLISLRLAGEATRSLLQRHPVPEALFARTPAPESTRDLRIGLSALPRVESQAHHFFSALRKIAFSGTVYWPVPEGEVERAQAQVDEFELGEQVVVSAGGGPLSWQEILGRCNVGVHLRFSAFGQPSPYLPMTLASGLPALVTDFASGAVYPDQVVFKISPGSAQEAEIAAVLGCIQESGVREYHELSRRFAAEFFHPQVVAQQLVQIFQQEQQRLAELYRRWNQLEHAAALELIRESRALSVQADTIIPGQRGTIVDPVYRELGWIAGDSI